MVSDEFKDFDIILASASPRRRELLREAGISFTPAEVDCDEAWPANMKGREIAEYLAALKSDHWINKLNDNQILITADTVVWCHDMFLGKPSGKAEAVAFLKLLSGCEHEVITGLCLRDNRRKHVFSVTTRVKFKNLSDEEIDFYVEKFRPFDKAGAYGIQEWIGLRGITRIEGSYYNVVGMPVSELYTALIDFINSK